MSVYTLEFLPEALEEWRKLEPVLREEFLIRLAERLKYPHVANARLHEMKDCYKIKLRAARYRLIYRVFDDRIVVQVIALGKRDDDIYITAAKRL